MEATHAHEHEHGHHEEHGHDAHDDHGHEHHGEHGHDAHGHDAGMHRDNWNDEEFVERWLAGQAARAPERLKNFLRIRALMPKTQDAEFRYLNLGAGPGNLDKVLLEHFHGANATLVDTSLQLLSVARQELASYGNRVEYVQANLEHDDWVGALGGPFDFVVASLAVHHVGEARRIRELYAEAYGLLGHGGMLLSLDYIRPARPAMSDLWAWGAKDPDANFSNRGHDNLAGSVNEHLDWLAEAGFGNADVAWKEGNAVILVAFRDHLHLPEGHDGHGEHEHGHSHAH